MYIVYICMYIWPHKIYCSAIETFIDKLLLWVIIRVVQSVKPPYFFCMKNQNISSGMVLEIRRILLTSCTPFFLTVL